jgi:hypothetical protein
MAILRSSPEMRIAYNQKSRVFLFRDRTEEELFESPSFLCDPILTGGLNVKRVLLLL